MISYSMIEEYNNLSFEKGSTMFAYSQRLNIMGKWECINYGDSYGLLAGVRWTFDTLNPTFFVGKVKFVLEFLDDKFIECDKVQIEDIRGFMCCVKYDDEDEIELIVKQRDNEPMLKYTYYSLAVNNMICPTYKIIVSAFSNFANFRAGIILPIISPDGTFDHFQHALSLVELRWYFDLARERLKPKPRDAADSSDDMPIDHNTRPDLICKICKSFVIKYISIPCGHPCCCGSCHRDINTHFNEYLTKCVTCKEIGKLQRVYL